MSNREKALALQEEAARPKEGSGGLREQVLELKSTCESLGTRIAQLEQKSVEGPTKELKKGSKERNTERESLEGGS